MREEQLQQAEIRNQEDRIVGYVYLCQCSSVLIVAKHFATFPTQRFAPTD